MKLLYITNSINASGGLERVLALKANYLADELNYQVDILTLNEGHMKPFYEFSKSIRFHDLKLGNPLTYFMNYKRGIQTLINTIKPDIISVCDDGFKGLLFPIIFKSLCPIIYERHAALNLNKKKHSLLSYLKTKSMQILARKFNAFIILTNGNKKDWPKLNCVVIPNPSPFQDIVKKNNSKEKLVLAVGSQDFNKGYDRLIDIWKIVHFKYPNWRLEIYGKQKQNLNLKTKIKQMDLSKTILLGNPVKQIEEKYKKAAIYVMTSRSEGFGMVLIEAMTYGIPCVSFNVPHGPADIISHNSDGFLIQNGDIRAFANAIINLIEDEITRSKMGEKAKLAVQKYNIENIMLIWDKLFKSLLSKK